MDQAASIADRRDHHLQGARTRLERWRFETWKELYTRRPWGYQVLLPDKVLTALAAKARFTSVEDLIGGGWSRTHARKHGPAVLEMLREYDALFREFAEGGTRKTPQRTNNRQPSCKKSRSQSSQGEGG
ncbi:hypothetical protein B0H13DRAFT_2079272 [Mycena leptocephala]|nr:hypothetical protein B0H13DRAFT_2079272 [Mycena leptocephala]